MDKIEYLRVMISVDGGMYDEVNHKLHDEKNTEDTGKALKGEQSILRNKNVV